MIHRQKCRCLLNAYTLLNIKYIMLDLSGVRELSNYQIIQVSLIIKFLI